LCRNPTFGKIPGKYREVTILPEDPRSQKGKSWKATGGPHPCQARVYPWPRLGGCGPPGHPLDLSFGLHKASDLKTSGGSIVFQKEFRSSAAIPKPRIGIRSLCSGTLPGRGIGGDHRHHHHRRQSINHP